jgi:hypothetical protein
MNPNAPKNREFINQFTFLPAILNSDMEPHGFPLRNVVNDLSIKVVKADGDLMYRRARNTGLGENSFCFQTKGKHKDHVMRCAEYIFAIGADSEILNRVNFPRNAEECRDLGEEVYAWSVLWAGRGTFANGSISYRDPIWDKVKYLVWVNVDAWHIDTMNDDSRFGDFVERAVRMTIYTEPEQGFEKLHRESGVYTNLWLDSDVMMRGALKNNHDILTIGGMLYEMCKTFEVDVYFAGMKDILDKGPYRGASGQFGSAKVLCAEMCGYDRVMLQDSACYITFQLRPDSKNMYVLGQQGTLPQIRNLVHTVVRMWRESPKVREGFKTNKAVSVI